jgi:hypothetical protein
MARRTLAIYANLAGDSRNEGPMMKSIWHAIYFATFDDTVPAARTTIIHADDESSACRIAIAQMGRCMKVHVTRPASEALERDVIGDPASAYRRAMAM